MTVRELLLKADRQKVLEMFAKDADDNCRERYVQLYDGMYQELLDKELITPKETTLYAVRPCVDDFEDGKGVIVDCYTESGFYALDFIPWGEVLNHIVADLSLQEYSAEALVYYLMDELSFYGVTEGDMQVERGKLDEAIAEVENGDVSQYHSIEEIFPDWNEKRMEYMPTDEEIAAGEENKRVTERYQQALDIQLQDIAETVK